MELNMLKFCRLLDIPECFFSFCGKHTSADSFRSGFDFWRIYDRTYESETAGVAHLGYGRIFDGSNCFVWDRETPYG